MVAVFGFWRRSSGTILKEDNPNINPLKISLICIVKNFTENQEDKLSLSWSCSFI